MWSLTVTASWSGLMPSEKRRVLSPTRSTSSSHLKAFRRQLVCSEPRRLFLGRYCCSARDYSASLYDRLGGKEPVKAVTSLLMEKLVKDSELGHYFERTTLGAHKVLLAQFLSAAFGGPKEYKGFQHPKHFNIVAMCLQESMDELSVPKDLADEVMSVAGSLEPEFARVAEVRKVIDGAT